MALILQFPAVMGSDLANAVELLCDHRLPRIQSQAKDTAPRSMSLRRRKVA